MSKLLADITPKADLTKTLAGFFEVSTDALTVPDIDSDIGLMHTLFALEDIRGLTIGEIDGEICLRLDKSRGTTYTMRLAEANNVSTKSINRPKYFRQKTSDDLKYYLNMQKQIFEQAA